MDVNERTISQVLQLIRDLSAATRAEEVCTVVAQGLVRLGVDHCEVVNVEQQDGGLVVGECLAVDDADPEVRGECLLESYNMAEYASIYDAVQRGQALRSDDPESKPELSEGEQALLEKLGLSSFVVCPMVSHGHALGYLWVGKRAGGLQPEGVVMCQSIAGQAAAAIYAMRIVSPDSESEVQTREAAIFKALAENAVDALCMATLGDHKLIYANPAYYDMHGHDVEDEVLGRVDDSFTIYDQAQGPTTTTQITRMGGLRREHQHDRKDGSSFIGLDTVFAVRDERGEVVALGNIIRDITRQKELEQRLKDLSDLRTWRLEVITEIAQEISSAPQMSELFHRVVNLVKERFDYYHTHLYLLDENGELEMVEGYGEPGRIMKERGHRIPVGRGMVGTAAETGLPVLSSDVSKRENWLANPLLPDTKSEIAVPIKMADQVLGVLDVQSIQLNGLTEDDQMLLMGLCGQIAVAIQNTRIVSNIQQLVEERTREVAIFASLADNATYGVLMMTPDGEVTYSNQANHEIFGYDASSREMVGASIDQFFAPEMRDRFGEQRSQLLLGKSWQVEADGLRKNGSTFNLLMVAFGILDDEGRPLSLVCMNQDVTEQRQLEAERARLNQEMLVARERLISELSAPLIPITENILVLPLIGAVDSARAELIMASLLSGINEYGADVVIVDVTGVPLMDTGVANHLLQMTNAASLVGARTILVGITPRVAQTIIELGVDLSSMTTRSNLQGGVAYALRLQGQRIARIE